MKDGVTHFIITRYNLSLYSDKSIRDRIKCSPDEWMEQRYELFTRFTLPSLQGQTCRNFTWIIFIDRQTPRHFREQLERVATSDMRIVELRGGQRDFLKKEIQNAKETVITSRIDNDDAWHKDFVKIIQTQYSRPTKLINFFGSYWLDLKGKRVYHHRWRWYYRFNQGIGNNPSMVERREDAKTVLAAHHSQLKKEVMWYQLKQITSGCYRLVVCHEHNLINSIKVGARRAREVNPDVLRDFNVRLDQAQSPPAV